SGNVGPFAVQIAKAFGAHVTGVARTSKLDLVREVGADAVIDYTKEPLSAHARRFDGAFDLVGGATLMSMFACVRRGGRIVSIAGVPEIRTALVDVKKPLLAPLFLLVGAAPSVKGLVNGVDYRFLLMRPDGAQLAELVALVDSGVLPVTLDREFPLARIAEAFEYLERGHAKGKVVVRIAGPDSGS
ncbi:MAG TPA: zinc-binding dehydrogenase, partial [Xanthomonadales bacterium]|nr:zinc-binding dehydrogenase [Xanthomonadales bacterium]